MARRIAAQSLRPRKHNRSLDKKRQLAHQLLERREMLAAELGPQLIGVAANSGENFRLSQSNVLRESPTQLTFRFDGSQQIDPATLAAITIERSGGDGSFNEGNEVAITPGFLGFGDSQRIVLARFAETLPDDQYRINIAGYDDTNTGTVGLRNLTGQLFNALNPSSTSEPIQRINFQVELGPQVVAVVPQPITGVGASRVQQRTQIQVFFNNDPLSNPALGVINTVGSPGVSVVNPAFYNLFFTNETVENTDGGAGIRPNNVIYDPALNMATLEFSNDLALLAPALATGGSGTYRLRVGSSQALPAAPTQVAETATDAGGLFTGARNLNTTFTASSSLVISGQVEPVAGNTIRYPGLDSPGIRDDRRDAQVIGRADTTDGINVFYYNFANLYGRDAGGNQLDNAITPAQKQRTREILSLYSRHLGVEFIETEDRGLQIVTGDLRALVEGATTGAGAPFQEYRVNDLDPTRGVLVLDASENWYDDYGLSPDARPSWFVEALRGIGNLLGMGSTFEQVPGVASGSNPALYNAAQFGITGAFSIEPDFLSTSDIIPLQALHRPETKDVDLYRFDVSSAGKISIETFAQRLDSTSSLNTDLKLWKLNKASGQYDLVARNDDFYSLDSFVGVNVSPNADGTTAQYFVGITASGNNDYDPSIAGSGGGGRSQGTYQMRVTFQNNASPTQTIRDTDGSLLDGDGDGTQGGDFNFWFRTAKTKATAVASEARTLFVDKSGTNSPTSGDLATPYRSIDYAFSQARPGDVVRVLPGAGLDGRLGTLTDNPAYEIGREAANGTILSDGETFNVPRGVTVMIDAGTIIKLRNAKISVGSERIDEDRSLAALQILGTPIIVDSNAARVSGEVNITSYDDESIGIDTNNLPTTPVPGNWAGIEFRNDVDYSEGRPVREAEGIFMGYVSHANIRYGGGSISATQPIVTPIQMLESRPTLIYNTIRNSSDAAVSADPNSFLETNFHAPIYQRVTPFTSDYDRVGPDIRGNRLVDNSFNGLFVRVLTPAGGAREPMTVSGRFNDRDIVHALSEVLVLQGQPGGSLLLEDRPDVLAVTLVAANATPSIANVGAIDYRVTFINSDGSESLASLPTRTVNVVAGQQVTLTNLPAAPTEFVGRRLYRLNPATGQYVLVTQLDRGTTTFVDRGVTRGGVLPASAIAATTQERLLPRFDARLSIDPGIVVKLDSARIEASFGADFYAEGTDGNPVVFTSRKDDTYGAGGTFDSNNDGDTGVGIAGDWSGLVFRQGSTASLDNTVVRYAGGSSAVGGAFASFNAVEILQADVRVANSLFSDNATGSTGGFGIRDGIGFNGPATIFVRGAQPVIVDNIIRNNRGAALSVNPDALNYLEVNDPGRSTGVIDLYVGDNDNQGPLIAGNRLDDNAINGMLVRNESLTTESVWDDTDIVHVVEQRVNAYNHHHRSGLRLKSDPNQSLVVKVQSGGSLHASQYASDVEDSIGGTIQVIGQPGFPVVLTSVNDCSVGAGFTPGGLPQSDTIESGGCSPTEVVVPGPSFVDVIVVIDESGSMSSTQAFTAQFIVDLENTLIANGVGVGGAGQTNRYGAVGFGNGIAGSNDGRSILVGGSLFGSAAQYATATSQFVTSGFSEDGFAAIDFALNNYTFRPDATKFIILATDEARARNTSATQASTIAALQSSGVIVAGILGVSIVNDSNARALAIDNRSVFVETPTSFTQAPGGRITGGISRTDYVPLVTATNGITGDLRTIGLSQASANKFSQVLSQSLADRVLPPTPASAGDWQGIVIEPGANDRNVAFIPENEQAIGTAAATNAIPDKAQTIGSIARSEVSSDENRRNGFTIRGALSQNSDIDVYRFTANGGTEVYIDIDDTSFGFDSVVELIDRNGNVQALSNNSDSEAGSPSLLFRGPQVPAGSVLPLYKTGQKIVENPNPLDAGMRVILAGNSNTVNEYFIRVRSSNLRPGDAASRLTDPNFVAAGLSNGQYQLAVRLRETDEVAGSTVRLADIRFATVAIDVPSAPSNSPLAGEFAEELGGNGLDVNDSPQNISVAAIRGGTASVNFVNADADPLGALSQSDRGVLRVSGELGNQVVASNVTPDYPKELDVDVFRVDIRSNTQGPDIIDENRFVSTIFDVDYASQFGGPNTSMAVFDSAGRLILHSRDSGITDDQGRPLLGNDPTNLSGGSAGTLDAYIGPVELQEGTYYVAVSSAQLVPSVLNQLFTDNPVDNAIRVLPIDSSRRLAEWGFNEDVLSVNGALFSGTITESNAFNTAADLPSIQPLFDDTSIVPYKLEDVRLFLTLQGGLSGNNQTTLISVDPFTGQLERTIGEFGPEVGDLGMRRDGELFAYTLAPGNANGGNTGNYLNISSADGTAANVGDDGLSFRRNNQAGAATEDDGNALFETNAMAFVPTARTTTNFFGNNPSIPDGERLFAIGNRTNNGRGELPDELRRNVVYSMVANGGAATNQNNTNANADRNFGNGPYVESFGPGSNKQEFGIVDTGQFADSPQPPDGPYADTFRFGGDVTGAAIDPLNSSRLFAVTNNGYVYSFSPNGGTRTVDVEPDAFGLNGSYNRVINTINYGQVTPHPDDFNSTFGGGVNFQSLAFGPRNTELGRFESILFGITGEGWLYAFRINQTSGLVEPAPVLFNGNYAVQLTSSFGSTLFEQPVGMAFSIRQENLWHTTNDFAAPFGNPDPNAHGVFIGHNQSRIRSGGGSSLYFGNEIDGNANNNTLEGGTGTLNPGGAHGTTVSAPFSLEGYSSADKPTLYFTYLLETEDGSDYTPARQQTDSFRVFAAGDDGQWRLVSTNDTWRTFSNAPTSELGGDDVVRGDEYDYYATNGGIPIQELFDQPGGANSTDWRQARIDLSPLAGNKNVQLRFDFSTAGGMQSQTRTTGYLTELQVTAGTDVIDGSTFTLQDTSQQFGVGTTTTFEFVRGASFNAPAGNFLINGQTISVVNAAGVTRTLTLTTDPASTAPNPVLFLRTDSAATIATAIATAFNLLDPTLGATATGAAVRVSEASAFTLSPADFGGMALTIPDANPSLVGRTLTFTNESGKQTAISLQTQQQVTFGFGAEQIQLTANTPGSADGVRVLFVDSFATSAPPIPDVAARATFNATTRVITVRYNSDPTATPTFNDFDAIVAALNAIPVGTTFTATLVGGTGTTAFTPPFATPTFASNEVYFALGDTGATIATAIADKLDQLDPSLTGIGGTSVVVASDLTTINFSQISFTGPSGNTTSLFLFNTTSNFDGTTIVAFNPLVDTAATVAQRIAARLNLFDPTLAAVAVGSRFTTLATNTVLDTGFTLGAGLNSGNELILPGAVNLPITVPADVTDPALNGATITFVSAAGTTTTATLTTSAPTSANQIQYNPAIDTPTIVAQKITNGLNALRFSFPGSGVSAQRSGDQITLTGARGLSLHPAFSNGTINASSINVGATAQGFLPNGNVPIFYTQEMTQVQLRDAVRDGLARGIGERTSFGFTQATIDNFPEYGTQRIRLFNQSVVANTTVLGVSSFLPGDEFGAAGSTSVSSTQRNIRPAQNNDIQGVYIDDIVIGFAERGEVVYNAPAGNRNFEVLPENRTETFQDTQQPEFPDELLVGQYTLEIRTGSEYGVPEDYDPIRLELNEQQGFGRSFDTNDRLTSEGVTLIAPSGIDLLDGDVFVLSNGTQQLTFEFDSNNSVTTGRVRVPFAPVFVPGTPGSTFNAANDDSTALARSIRDAINSPQAFGVLGIYASGRDGREAGFMSGNRVELFGKSIQVNPTSGRFNKIDLVAEETFYGRETARVIPIVDHANQTVIDAIFPNTFARATTTNFINGTTDTLVAVGKVGDHVLTRDGGGNILYNDSLNPATTINVSPIVNNNGNVLISTLPESDFDIVKIYLRSGDVIDLDLDTVGWNLGTNFVSPVMGLFSEVAGAAPQLLVSTTLAAAPGESNVSAFVDNFTAPRSGYYYVVVASQTADSYGEYQLNIRPGDVVSNGVPVARDVLMVDYHLGKGDTNVFRDQGQFIIDSNFITDYSTAGIRASFGNPANDDDALFTNTPLDRRPGSAATLNSPNLQRLLPGTVISNNLLVSSAGTGISFSGEVAAAGDSPAPVPFGRIVNNTVVGSGSGVGVQVSQSASPTVLNNIITGFTTGLSIAGNSSTTVEGANAFQGNGTNSTQPLAPTSSVIPAASQLFQDAAGRIYIPAAGSSVIDSSFASLGDRTTFFNTVKDPVGISASPIIAPSFDAYGIPRFDDPNATTPSGVGSNVFIDRGAIDRADFIKPRAVLVAPQDFIVGEGIQLALGDNDPDASFVRLPVGSSSVAFFEVQLLDPAGSGPNPSTITSDSVLVTEDGIRLVAGIDYVFGYSPNSRVIRLTPTAGLWRPDSVYEITLNNEDRVGLDLPTGDQILDGDRYIVTDSRATAGNVSIFEYDSGYVLQVPQTLGLQVTGATNLFVDGQTFTITAPGGASRTFEINRNGSVISGNIEINLKAAGVIGAPASPAGTIEEIRNVILAAISSPSVATALNLAPSALNLDSLQIGSLTGHAITGNVAGLTTIGVANGVDVGEQLRYRSGPDDVLFEFTSGSNAPTDPTAIAIPISRTNSPDQVAAAIALALSTQPLGLASARAIGDGRVLVGGAVGDVLTLVNTQLQQLGAPGVTGALTLTVPANATTTSLEGRTFSVQNGSQVETFVFTTNPALATTARRIVLTAGATPAQVAGAAVTEINTAFTGGLTPSSRGNVIVLGEQPAIIPAGTTQVRASVNAGASTLIAAGVSGGAIAVPFIPTSLFTSAAAAATLNTAVGTSPLLSEASNPGGGTLLFSATRSIQFQRGANAITTVGSTLPAITDLAGNSIASNRDNSETRFTIIMPEVRFDFGDAPNTYGTLIGNNGARHSVGSSATPRLGTIIDTETNGQVGAVSDDTVVSISATSPGASPLFSFAFPSSGAANIRINDITPTSGSRVTVTIAGVSKTFELISPGIAPLLNNIAVPLLAGDTAESIATRLTEVMRTELTSVGSAITVSLEPTQRTVVELRTLDDEDGVAVGRLISGATTYNVFLTPGTPSTTSDPADVVGFLNPQDPLGTNISVAVTGAGLLDAWIDFDGNGVFDSSDQVLKNTPVVDGINTVRVFTPAGTTNKNTWARFRLSTGGNLNATGVAIGGEVEDYQVQIINIPLPQPADDLFTINEDTVLDTVTNVALASVIDNDTIPAETFLPVRFFIGAEPTNGTLVVTDPTSGRFVYTPAPDFSGVDQFTYRLSTQSNAGATAPAGIAFATVTIRVRPVNDAPSAIDKAFATVEDLPLTITAAQLLAGSIPDANPQYPASGAAAPWNESNQLMRILSVQAGNTVITGANAAVGPFATARGNISARFNVNGTLIDLTYTPNQDLNRDNVTPVSARPVLDSFLFTVEDDGLLVNQSVGLPPVTRTTAVATATINVTPRNDAPTVAGDSVSVGIVGTTTTATPWNTYFTGLNQPTPIPTEDTALTIPSAYLLANDLPGSLTARDENGFVNGNDGALTITNVTAVTAGLTVTLDANGNVVLTPPRDIYGEVVFTYNATDRGVDETVSGTRTANPLTSTGTVTVTLQPINDRPVAADRSLAYVESADPGVGSPFTFNAATLINGAPGETPAVPGAFAANLAAPFNESDQTLRVVAFRTAAGTVDVASLTNGTGTLTLASDAGGSFAFTFVNGAFTTGQFTPSADYNQRTPFAAVEAISFQIADNGRTTRPQGGGFTVLPDQRSAAFATATITVAQSNDAPVFSLPSSTINVLERDDSGATVVTGAFAGILPGPITARDETARQTVSFEIIAGSSTVPTGLMLQAPQIAPNGTLTVFPAPNAVGVATYVFEAVDAEAGNPNFVERRTRGTITIAVRPVNDAPVLNPAVFNTSQTSNADEAWSVDGSGTITFTLKEDNTGALGVTSPYVINVRRDPAVIGYQRIGLLDIFSAGPANEENNTEGGPQSLRLFQFQARTALGGIVRASGFANNEVTQLEYIPPTDINTTGGIDSFTFEVQDDNPNNGETFNLGTGTLANDRLTALGTVRFRLNPVNDRPQFNVPTPEFSVLEDTGAFAFEDFVTDVFAGPPNTAFDETDSTSGQTVTFSVTAVSSTTGLFSTSPTINAQGTLSFVTAPDAYGRAVLEVRATDSGTDNATRGDIVSSTSKFITINIRPVNDRPVLNTTNPIVYTLNEDAAVLNTNGTVTNRGTFLPLRGSSGQVGLLDVFNVGPANESANINPGGNQSLSLTTPIPTNTVNGGTLTQERDVLGNLLGLRYTPRANFNGTDTFVYGVIDNGVSTDIDGNVRNEFREGFTTVTLQVVPRNDAPLFGGAPSVTVDEDAATTTTTGQTVIPAWATNIQAGPAGATDELDPVTGQSVTFTVNPVSGNPTGLFSAAPSVSANGTLRFVTAPNANGVAVFTVVATDSGISNPPLEFNTSTPPRTFTITVNAVNDAPTFTPGANVTVDEDSGPYSSTVPYATNISPGPADEVAAGQTVRFEVITPSSGQSLFAQGGLPEVTDSGFLRFTPADNVSGTVEVTITAIDSGNARSAPATLRITIGEVNDVPVATNDLFTANEDNVRSFTKAQILNNDFDPDLSSNPAETLTIIGVQSSSLNGAALRIGLDGTIQYDPRNAPLLQALAPGQTRSDTFTYRVQDLAGRTSNLATITVNVSGINDAPVLLPDNPTLVPGGVTIIRPLINDSDIDGTISAASLQITLQPAFGALEVQPDGTLIYTPFDGFRGQDVIRYTVADNLGLRSAEQTITIDVNQAPIANNDASGTFRNESVDINVATNDSDPDGTLNLDTVEIITQPTRGSVIVVGGGVVRYLPDTGFTGLDSFQYTIRDNAGRASNVGTVSVQTVASRLQNPKAFTDVNASGETSPVDALLIINKLARAARNGQTGGIPVLPSDVGPNFFDVDGNLLITPNDALRVINQISRQNRRQLAAGEGESARSTANAAPPVTISSSVAAISQVSLADNALMLSTEKEWQPDFSSVDDAMVSAITTVEEEKKEKQETERLAAIDAAWADAGSL
jgi:hypothetical protein